MATYYHTDGICLRRLDYSNTSQVATFLTPDQGQVPFIAKGIYRAPKRGIRAGLDLAARYGLVYFKPRSGSLYNLTECSMLDAFAGMRQSVQRIVCGYYAAELMLNLTAESDPCRELYDVLVETLGRCARGEALGMSVLTLEIAALRHYGSCPTFNRCAECDAPLRLTGRLLFSAAQGGPLCLACGRRLYRRPHPAAIPVRAERLGALASLAGNRGQGNRGNRGHNTDFSVATRGTSAQPGKRNQYCVPDFPMDPDEIVAASRLVRFHMRYLLGKELRMWKYLHGRHLSRTLRTIRRSAGLA